LAILGRLELPDQGYEPHPPPGGSDRDTGRGYRLPEKMTKGIRMDGIRKRSLQRWKRILKAAALLAAYEQVEYDYNVA